MSREKLEEMTEEEIRTYNEGYLDSYNEQEKAKQDENDAEYLKWYNENVAESKNSNEEWLDWYNKQQPETEKKGHNPVLYTHDMELEDKFGDGVEEIPAKIGARKHALATDKMKTDRKAMRKDRQEQRIAKMARRKEILLEEAEMMYAVAETEEEIAKADELSNQAKAVEKRMQSNAGQKKYDAQKAKEKRNYKQHQETDRRVYGQVVEETWGQEKGEFATLADKEAFEKRSAAAKKGAQTKKANQRAHDDAYEQWYIKSNEEKSK